MRAVYHMSVTVAVTACHSQIKPPSLPRSGVRSRTRILDSREYGVAQECGDFDDDIAGRMAWAPRRVHGYNTKSVCSGISTVMCSYRRAPLSSPPPRSPLPCRPGSAPWPARQAPRASCPRRAALAQVSRGSNLGLRTWTGPAGAVYTADVSYRPASGAVHEG